MSLNEKIIKIRVELQNSEIKKSGKNKFAGFTYFELADFLPKLNELMLKDGVNDLFSIDGDVAKLTLISGDEKQEYTIPFVMFDVPLNKSGQPSMQGVQYLGALNTYYKRYLYLNAFGITDGELIDRMNNEEINSKKNNENAVDFIAENKEKYTNEQKDYLKTVVKSEKEESHKLAIAKKILKENNE